MRHRPPKHGTWRAALWAALVVWLLAAPPDAAAASKATSDTAPAAPRCDSTDTCLSAIEDAHRDVRSFTASLVQTKHLALLTEPLISRGRLAFERPDKLVWEIETPDTTRIVMNGGRLSVPGLSGTAREAIESAAAQTVSRLGAMFTGDLGGLRDNFETTAVAAEDAIAVTLVPRRNDIQAVRTIELRFDEPDLHIADIRIVNTLGDVLDLTLTDVKRNAEIPASTFDLEAGDETATPAPPEH